MSRQVDIQTYWDEKKRLIDQALDKYLPSETSPPEVIHRAMRDAVFPGGKRLRPILTLAASEVVGSPIQPACAVLGTADLSACNAQADRKVLPTACALELIHAYSLIHDDLPALDNDDYRRGKLSTHKAFGEDIAILAGDALLTLAFELISKNGEVEGVDKDLIPLVTGEVARAVGTSGMIGGQVDDLRSGGENITPSQLESIHRRKTGALIETCLRAGAILGGGKREEIETLSRCGQNIGLAFQIADDIRDVEGEEKGKATYPSLLGLEKSRGIIRELTDGAKKELSLFGERGETLEKIADWILPRTSGCEDSSSGKESQSCDKALSPPGRGRSVRLRRR